MRLIPIAYLASYFLSLLGNAIAGVALPLIMLERTGSALGAGTVAAATAVPALFAGLVMGTIIDRINRRTSSVVTDVISAAAIAALPIVDMITGLTLGWFVLFGIIGSLGDIPGMTARETLLPAIVRHSGQSSERLVGAREALGAAALLLGPAAAGILMSLFDGSAVLWITAGTSLAAALTTLLIPHRVGRLSATPASADAPRNVLRQLHEGWVGLLRSRFLMAVTLISTVSVFVLGSLQGLVLPAYFTFIGQPGLLGFVLTALAIGLLVGGGVYASIGSRMRRRVWLLIGLFGTTAGFAIVAPLSSPILVFVGAAVIGASSGLFNSLLGVLMIERIPDHLRGRIMSTQNALTTVAAPAGIFLAGVLVEYTGLVPAAIVITAFWLLAAGLGIFARSMHTLESDAGPDEETMADAQQ